MDLEIAKAQLTHMESHLQQEHHALFDTFERDGTTLEVWLSPHLYQQARRGRVWKSKAMLTTLKNAAYGFEPNSSRSRGGRDGLFVVDRHFKPANTMMSKLFGFMDHPRKGPPLASWLGVPLDELIAVRLVSHHMRLLGVLANTPPAQRLVLVDWDNDKH